jgi:hypothetical protein
MSKKAAANFLNARTEFNMEQMERAIRDWKLTGYAEQDDMVNGEQLNNLVRAAAGLTHVAVPFAIASRLRGLVGEYQRLMNLEPEQRRAKP